MVPFAGWSMPVQYTGLVAEHHAVRKQAGLFDVSHMGQLDLLGPKALEVANEIVAKDLSKLPVGKGAYTVACNEAGGILDDLIVYRLSAEHVFIICNASRLGVIAPHVAKRSLNRCEFADRSASSALIALQGPSSLGVLAALDAPAELGALKRFGIAAVKLAGIEVRAARTGYTGEDGFEIACHAEHASQLWNALLEAGKTLGLAPAGLGARDTLRLEAALALYGNDIDESTNPIEAGLAWVVSLDKTPFVGQAALKAIASKTLARKLVGLKMTERGNARHGYAVLNAQGEKVGEVTSGSPSPTLGYSIALAYIPTSLSEPGSKVRVQIREQSAEAQVVPTPFYKRQP